MSCSLDEVACRFANQPGLTVLLQGGGSFVNQHRRWVEKELKCSKTLEIMPKEDAEGWDDVFLWKMDLSHRALGGVTSGTWLMRCSEALDQPQKGLAHNLGLVLNPTHGGRAESKVSPELLKLRKPLSGSNLILPGNNVPWVRAPSVFTEGDELVVRWLQIDEMLDIYDVEVATQKELGTCWRLGQWSPSYAFTNAAPLKVLMAVGRLFYNRLRLDGMPLGLPRVNENAASHKRAIVESMVESATGAGYQAKQRSPCSSNQRQSKQAKLLPA